MRKQAGFTLMELLIVIAIISILGSIGYASYSDYMIDARRGEATSSLMTIAQAQEKYYLDNNVYARDHSDLGIDTKTFADNYEITIVSPGTRQTYSLSAKPASSSAQATDSECDDIIYNSVGTKTPTVCWE